MEGNFSVQKSPISGVAIGCDHALEQVNCGDKSRGGLKGITKNHNARIRQYLVAPVIEQISQEFLEKGNAKSCTTLLHHQLKKAIIDRQNTRILNLVQILLKSDLELEKSNGAIQNIMTGKVFLKEKCEKVVSCKKVG